MLKSLLALSLFPASVVSDFNCDLGQADYCNGTESSYSCSPYTPTPTAPWGQVRKDLITTLFGQDTLPTRSTPDYIRTSEYTKHFFNCGCLTTGACTPDECSLKIQQTEIVFTIKEGDLILNSTIFLTGNSSGIAVENVPVEGPVGFAPFPRPSERGDTLVLFHNGHSQPCDVCDSDHKGDIDFLNQLGFDTMQFQMPLFQCNYNATFGCNHGAFQPYQNKGYKTMRFFLEPVVLAINYAKDVLGYKNIAMVGLSGGGWTTTMMGGIDPRINLTIPIAGSIPCDFAHSSWDFEQKCNMDWAKTCNYTCLYTLAALEPYRTSVQVIHEQDPCCFHGCGRHDRIKSYNKWVQSQAGGGFVTAPTVGNIHEVNYRDKVIVSTLVDKLNRGGIIPDDLKNLPFNTLNQW